MNKEWLLAFAIMAFIGLLAWWLLRRPKSTEIFEWGELSNGRYYVCSVSSLPCIATLSKNGSRWKGQVNLHPKDWAEVKPGQTIEMCRNALDQPTMRILSEWL